MKFAHVNGVAIHYADDGAADGPALVFVNSLSTDFRIWDGVVALLSARFRVIRYDKRGHGLSEVADGPYAMDDHVGDLAGLLDHLGIARPHLCGLSVGGMIAQAFASAHPDRTERLILIGTAAKIGEEAMWNERIAAVMQTGLAPMIDGIMEKWFTPAFRRDDNPLFTGMKTMVDRTSPQGHAATCATLRDADLTASTSALDLPVLVIVGDQDGSTPPALVKATADIIPGARFETIANAAHIPCVEQPDATAQLILEFLSHTGHG